MLFKGVSYAETIATLLAMKNRRELQFYSHLHRASNLVLAVHAIMLFRNLPTHSVSQRLASVERPYESIVVLVEYLIRVERI